MRLMDSEGKVNCYMNYEIIDALDAETEDIVIIWVLTADGQWQLCVQCDLCEAWLRYPWVDHPCEDVRTQFELVEEITVQMVIETSIDRLKEGLVCHEVLDSA